MILRKSLVLLGLVLTISSLSSCIPKVPVPQTFWQEKKARVAVAVATGDGRGHFYKEGNQGLLDIAINSAMTSGPDKALANLKPDTFRKVKTSFAAELRKRGLTPVEVKDDLQLKDYPKLKGGDSMVSGKDYSAVLSAYKADYLIVLNLGAYGSVRPYYGFIPLSAPSGYSVVNGFMVKRGATKPIWNSGMANANKVPVDGDWDQGPEFRNLINATLKAIEGSRGFLTSDFFN